MKLFKLSIGHTEVYAVGDDMEDMERRKAEVDHTFAFLPVVIEEVMVEGYTITVTPDDLLSGAEASTTTRRKRGAAQ